MNHHIPPQSQKKQPGIEAKMNSAPIYLNENYKGSDTLLNKIALITGGDSEIGRAVACIYSLLPHRKRPGQPAEIAPSYVFLASDDSSYMSGQVLHPNGGVIVNS